MKIRVLRFEGRVDVLFYGTILRKIFGYRRVESNEFPEEILNFSKVLGEILPICETTIFVKGENWVFLRAEKSKDSLEKICCIIGKQHRFIRQKQRELSFDFLTLFLFDIDAAENYKRCKVCINNAEILKSLAVETPEKIVIEASKFLPSEKRERIDKCRQIIVSDSASLSKSLKQEFTLIKALIGWRCYYHFFETLFEYEKCRKRVLSMLSEDLLRIFEEG